MAPIIFLDIDGVLAPFSDDVPTYPVFVPRCVDALKSKKPPFVQRFEEPKETTWHCR